MNNVRPSNRRRKSGFWETDRPRRQTSWELEGQRGEKPGSIATPKLGILTNADAMVVVPFVAPLLHDASICLGVCPSPSPYLPVPLSPERAIITSVIVCHMLVFDSSTLILTAKIELLDLFLREIGMEVAIPRTVEEECCGGKKTLDAFMIQKAVDESRIIGAEREKQEAGAEIESEISA